MNRKRPVRPADPMFVQMISRGVGARVKIVDDTTEKSVKTSIDSYQTQMGVRHLYHRTAGSIPAGAGSTIVRESWGCVLVHTSGTTSGQWFTNRADAEKMFNAFKSEGR